MQKESSEIHDSVSVENAFDEETLGLVYMPGVAYVAAEISNNKELVYDYTSVEKGCYNMWWNWSS
jgi:malic enzyme